MGCFHSKNESTDLHPNVFRVVNIDENGADLCSGQLEITDTDIVLYREGRDSTVWPLHSLRRYGFEADIFSFESGRRCETGEGIYAFKCRRASLLFHTLQQQIQQRNVNQDTAPYPSTPYPVSRLTPNSQSRQTLQASVVHRSSVDNGQSDHLRPLVSSNLANLTQAGATRNVNSSLRSSSGDILEVMPLYPRSQNTGNQVTNVYQLRGFKREHNNNQNETTNYSQPVYCNDLNRDLAILRKTLRKETALQSKIEIEDETKFLEGRYMNDSVSDKNINNFVSPTMSNSSEHYAKLSLEQQESVRLYMNVVPNETQLPDTSKIEVVPTTPLTPKQVEYYNLPVGNAYANLSLGELGSSTKNIKHGLSFSALFENQKFSESDTFTSPVEELEVNYAVLDIDINKEGKHSTEVTSPEIQSHNSSKNDSMASSSSQSRSRLLSQCSVEKVPTPNTPAVMPPNTIGYTTIDFDKTVALTSVASGTTVDADGPRKTRHNSCNVVCSSPTTERNKASYT